MKLNLKLNFKVTSIVSAVLAASVLLITSAAVAAPVVTPGKATKPYPSQMPPVAMMQMQQREGLQARIEKKQQFVIATEAELARLDAELQKSVNYSNPKLMKAMRTNKKAHQQNLAQARIDLSVLEKESMQFATTAGHSGSQRFFSKVQKENVNKVKK